MLDELMQEGPNLFLPVLAMVAVTIAVYFRLYFVRVRPMIRQRIHPQKVATRAAKSQVTISDKEAQASDNVQNLFEAPVLFYVLAIVIEMAGMADVVFLGLAWFFVASRALHSIIHCTYNIVMHRFTVFIIGVFTLAIMALRLGWLLLA